MVGWITAVGGAEIPAFLAVRRAVKETTHGTRILIFFGGYGYVATQDGTSRSESLGLRRLEVVRSAYGHCSILTPTPRLEKAAQ